MKYLVLCFDTEGDTGIPYPGYYVCWWGTNKKEAERQYRKACKEYRYVRLDKVTLIKEQTDSY